MGYFKSKNPCDKISKIKLLRLQSCWIFCCGRCGILCFFCRCCSHGDICNSKWPFFQFFEKVKKTAFCVAKFAPQKFSNLLFFLILGIRHVLSDKQKKRFENPTFFGLTQGSRFEETTCIISNGGLLLVNTSHMDYKEAGHVSAINLFFYFLRYTMLSRRNVNHREYFHTLHSQMIKMHFKASLINIAFFQQCNSLALKLKLTIKIQFKDNQ